MISNEQIKDVCRVAHNNSIEFYEDISKARDIKESNEHFVNSHLANELIKRHNYFVSFETIRSLVELSITNDKEFLAKDREENESEKHRFDLVAWNGTKPSLVFEVKAIGNAESVLSDVGRLWLLQRRLGKFHKFKCVFMFSNWYIHESEKSWNDRLASLNGVEYKFDPFYFEGTSSKYYNSCSGVIIDYNDVGENYRVQLEALAPSKR